MCILLPQQFKWGIGGAAWATVGSQYVSMVCLLWALQRSQVRFDDTTAPEAVYSSARACIAGMTVWGASTVAGETVAHGAKRRGPPQAFDDVRAPDPHLLSQECDVLDAQPRRLLAGASAGEYRCLPPWTIQAVPDVGARPMRRLIEEASYLPQLCLSTPMLDLMV